MKRFSLLISTLIIMSLILNSCSSKMDLSHYKSYYHEILKELSSEKYMGRSEYNKGAEQSAEYIMEQIKKIGLAPVPGHDYFQPFEFPLNVMWGEVEFAVDGKPLKVIDEFILKEFSSGKKGTYDLYYLEEEHYTKDGFVKHLNSGKFDNKFVVLDFEMFWDKLNIIKGEEAESFPSPLGVWESYYDKQHIEIYQRYLAPLTKVAGIVFRYDTMPHHYKGRAHYAVPMPVVGVGEAFPEGAKQVTVNFDTQLLDKYQAKNIIAWIPGKNYETNKSEDHYILIAHYDHLGLMGKENIFYGANDNASGVALQLTLAEYFSKPENQPDKSIMLIFVDAEEENMIGSFYYYDHPFLPTTSISYLIDLDMIADDGHTLQCQTCPEGEAGLALVKEICREKGYFTDFNQQELAWDSDHFPFAINGVPALYVSVEGSKYKYYHTPYDTYENTTDINYENFFGLVVDFLSRYGK